MAKFPGLTKRSGSENWYVRRKVPVKAQQGFPSDTVSRSTGTSNHSEAKKKYPLIWAELDREFDQVIRQANPSETASPTDTEIERLAALYLHNILDEDEEARREGVSDKDFRKDSESINIALSGTQQLLARGDTSTVEWEVNDLLESQGITLDSTSAPF